MRFEVYTFSAYVDSPFRSKAGFIEQYSNFHNINNLNVHPMRFEYGLILYHIKVPSTTPNLRNYNEG